MDRPRLPPLKLRRDATGAIQVTGAPERPPVIARAAVALADLARRAQEDPEARPVDVQPVVQVSGAAGYQRWRADRETIWRAQRAPYTTAGWPARLGPDLLAGVLLPLPFGAPAAGRGRKAPRVVAPPLFSTRSRTDGSVPEDVALGLIAEWLHQQSTSGPALRVAPPILEVGTQRRVLDLDLPWPLAGRGA